MGCGPSGGEIAAEVAEVASKVVPLPNDYDMAIGIAKERNRVWRSMYRLCLTEVLLLF